MGSGKSTVKYALLSFNFLFWLAGLAAIGVGIWMIFDPGRYNDFLGQYTFTVPASMLIATGLFVNFVSFCGCFGAFRESKCMLGTYFTMLLLIFCAEIAAGVLAFLYRDKIKEEITSEAVTIVKNKYGTGDSDLDHVVNLAQEKLKCCGARKATDYDDAQWTSTQSNDKTRPESCCSDASKCAVRTDNSLVYTSGCIDELTSFIEDNLVYLGAIGIALACIQLLGMCFACCMFFAIDEY